MMENIKSDSVDTGAGGDSSLRSWKFRVMVPNVHETETICVTGDCLTLGYWAHEKIITLVREENTNYWSNDINIPLDSDVSYRYCAAVIYDSNEIAIKHWETNLKPRKILKGCHSQSSQNDTYAEYDGSNKVDKGWLTIESLLQFKFFGNPFTFKSNIEDHKMYVKLTPVSNHYTCNLQSESSPEGLQSIDKSDKNILKYMSTDVAVLDKTRSQFRLQDEFGCVYNSEDYLIFNVQAPQHLDLSYLVDFYMKHSIVSTDVPKRFGYTYILPNVLKKSQGQLQLPIMCNSKHRPIGTMVTEYLRVNPMPKSPCNLNTSLSTYWSTTWTGLEVGHRGSGSSFKKTERTNIRENTIASFKTAAASGADLLEFDVQLSKDLIPVVYHDFHVSLALKRKKQIEITDVLEIPMSDLTFDQLQKLKVLHVVEGRSEPRFFDEDLVDHQPFPLLSDVLKSIDPNVGFNVEIKWTMQKEDGTNDLEHPMDLNLYIDKILDVVLRFGMKRHIVFSCFHPDVCTVVKMKQNMYPTMFLTQGVTNKYSKLRDPRCNSIESAVYHALNAELLGIVVHTEDLLRDSSQVKLVVDAGLIIFCWGEDNNNKDTIKHLKQLGLHGVIFDKLDQYSTKNIKESIFLMESKEALREIEPPKNTINQDTGCGESVDKK